MTKIKICGLQSEDDIAYVNELKPDYIGFVFLKGRRRYISPEDAAHLRKLLNPSIQSVGVFVDEPFDHVASLLESGTIQIAQLHGSEEKAYAEKLKKLYGKPIIKAFIIRTMDDIKNALNYPSDYLLLDNGLGTGETFDWSFIKDINRPFFLAGGLNPDNVREAISLTNPYGVDTSSGVETNCKKDYYKIKAFIDAVRNQTAL